VVLAGIAAGTFVDWEVALAGTFADWEGVAAAGIAADTSAGWEEVAAAGTFDSEMHPAVGTAPHIALDTAMNLSRRSIHHLDGGGGGDGSSWLVGGVCGGTD
jgi:hypothetical protein